MDDTTIYIYTIGKVTIALAIVIFLMVTANLLIKFTASVAKATSIIRFFLAIAKQNNQKIPMVRIVQTWVYHIFKFTLDAFDSSRGEYSITVSFVENNSSVGYWNGVGDWEVW